MWKELKIWLWKMDFLQLWETCPICGSQMMKQGFRARYQCLRKNCEWNILIKR